MNFKRYFLQLFLCFSILLPVIAWANGVENLQNKLNQLKSFTADFTQKVLNQDGSVLQQSTGSLAVDKPGKFRWQVNQPFPQTIIANGKTVWIYDAGLEQVTIRNLGKSMSQTPILLLSSNAVDLTSEFSVTQQGDTFQLLPKVANQDFKSVLLTFQGNVIAQMQFQSNLGQMTTLQFNHVKYNPGLSDRLFVFTPPKGADIVDQRHE